MERLRWALGSPLVWNLVLWALVIAFAALALGGVSDKEEAEQRRILENAVRRSAMQCYALEGAYPESLDALVEKYGLAIDRERFIVHYEYIGGNLLPEISVFAR